MFNNCYILNNVPLFDTSKVTNMGNMFQNCRALVDVPPFNTDQVTNMGAMFNGCFSLKSVPFFNTLRVTDMASMFRNCRDLTGTSNFNTLCSTDFNGMFQGCVSITVAPRFNLSRATNINNMFNGATNLREVYFQSCSAITAATNALYACDSLCVLNLSGMSVGFDINSTHISKENMEDLFYTVGSPATTRSITITTSYAAKLYPSIAVASVTTTAGSLTATTSSSVATLSANMIVTGVGTPTQNARAVTFTDTFTSPITTTTGILPNIIYYVVNATNNTFQVAATQGGSALPLTSNGSGNLKYIAKIDRVVSGSPNSIVFDRPMGSAGTNTLNFRFLNTGIVNLKNWTVVG
jgi:surface protein